MAGNNPFNDRWSRNDQQSNNNVPPSITQNIGSHYHNHYHIYMPGSYSLFSNPNQFPNQFHPQLQTAPAVTDRVDDNSRNASRYEDSFHSIASPSTPIQSPTSPSVYFTPVPFGNTSQVETNQSPLQAKDGNSVRSNYKVNEQRRSSARLAEKHNNNHYLGSL